MVCSTIPAARGPFASQFFVIFLAGSAELHLLASWNMVQEAVEKEFLGSEKGESPLEQRREREREREEQQEMQKPACETAAASRCANCTVTGRETPTLAAATVPTHSNSHLLPQFYKVHITYTFFLSSSFFLAPIFEMKSFFSAKKMENSVIKFWFFERKISSRNEQF